MAHEPHIVLVVERMRRMSLVDRRASPYRRFAVNAEKGSNSPNADRCARSLRTVVALVMVLLAGILTLPGYANDHEDPSSEETGVSSPTDQGDNLFRRPAGKAKISHVAPSSKIGPRNSQGEVIWLHGWCPGWQDCSRMATPHHIIHFSKSNRDIYRINIPTSHENHDDVGYYFRAKYFARHALYLAEMLRSEGYEKLILSGYSGGAMGAIFAGTLTDKIYGILAVAPCCGTDPTGPYIPTVGFYDLLRSLKAKKISLVFFRGEVNAPDDLGVKSKKILDRRGVQSLIIDRPNMFHGHLARLGWVFTSNHGDDILKFIGQP